MGEFIQSLDPRIVRLQVREDQEVFHQAKTGARLIHVGSLHAPSPDLALVFAKEQYGRRATTTDMWVVRTADIFTLRRQDVDMFETAPEKLHREPQGYMEVRKYIDEFKKRQQQEGASDESETGSH